MKIFRYSILYGFLILLSPLNLSYLSVAYAQDTESDVCITLVRDALDLTRETCESTTGRNQACYGNITLQVEPQPGINELTFEQRGDIVDVESIRTLRLSSMNREADEWGVAYLRLQTSFEEDNAEDITLLMFGDVQIENAVEPVPDITTLEVTPTANVNVRSGPSINGAVITALTSGQTVIADGRIKDGSWLRIQLNDDIFGWVFTELMSFDDDISILEEVAADSEPFVPQFGPMQAFFIATGSDDAPCKEAPDSGLMIQTPEGVGEISLVVNEVDIRLRSTAYIQSQSSSEMVVNLLEGSGRVTALGTTVFVPAGTQVRIDMDANNTASSKPSEPEPYGDEIIVRLPVSVLPRAVDVVESLDLAEANSNIYVEVGKWTHISDNSCGSGHVITGSTIIESTNFRTYVESTWYPLEVTNPNLNHYVVHFPDRRVELPPGSTRPTLYEYWVIDSTHIETRAELETLSRQTGLCIGVSNGILEYVGP